jgi:hypothetical protein
LKHNVEVRYGTEAFPAPRNALSKLFYPHGYLQNKSKELVTCTDCQQSDLFWSWNWAKRKPLLVEDHGFPHHCPTPHTRDIFPGWCLHCKALELMFVRKSDGFELTESYGLPHACEQEYDIQDMSEAKCKFCKTDGLFWVKVNHKYTLTHSDGTRHNCALYSPYIKDWNEAKRMNYAFEKAWLKAIPDNTPCKKCKGKGHTEFLSKNKKTMAKFGSSEPILMHRPCLKCKRLGIFTKMVKAEYLKALRIKYWPFNPDKHKWKQYNNQ